MSSLCYVFNPSHVCLIFPEYNLNSTKLPSTKPIFVNIITSLVPFPLICDPFSLVIRRVEIIDNNLVFKFVKIYQHPAVTTLQGGLNFKKP